MSFQLVSEPGLLILGFTALRVKMSARGLVHDDTFIFDGTNYDIWKIHMLNYFWVMDPNIEIFLDMDFSLPMDYQNLSLEDEKNLYLEAQVSNELIFSLRPDFLRFLMYIGRKSSHEMWIDTLQTYL